MKREYGYKARTGGPRYQDMGRNEAPTEPDVVINEKPLNDVEEELELDENAAKPVVDATVEDETLTAVEPEQVPAEPADMAETDSLLDEMAEEEAVEAPVVEEKEEVGDLPDNLTGFMDMDSKQLNPEEAEKKAKEDAAEEAAMSEEEGTSTNDELKDTKKDIKPKAKSKKSKSNDSKRSK